MIYFFILQRDRLNQIRVQNAREEYENKNLVNDISSLEVKSTIVGAINEYDQYL